MALIKNQSKLPTTPTISKLLLEACKESLKEFKEMGYIPRVAQKMCEDAIAVAEKNNNKEIEND